MGTITVRLGTITQTVSCADGQEAHLAAMAGEVERRIARLRELGGGSVGGDLQLMVLAALMLADEVHDLRAELATKPREIVREVPMPERDLAAYLDSLARRAEEIAAGMERA
ncbi:MAG TPA: cell division protein ZapA [Acidisphaera sp.]|nr:cell division protein ZapA [Acidisphaera sp.]